MIIPRIFYLLCAILSLSLLFCHCEQEKTYKFQAEVNKMMDIIIHSLYKTKEIFLRELISNASDALDKLRLLVLMNSNLVPSDWQYNITIRADKDNHRLVIKDTGVGMSESELVTNLGTIAKSGTKDFVEAINKNQNNMDMQQIGQFGVGFYSVFLVADSVTVISKAYNGTKYVWKCNIGEGQFSIHPATLEDDLIEPITHSGTKIIIDLKPDADDISYTDDDSLTDLIHKHSEFINFPIYLYKNETRVEQVSIEESEQDKKEGIQVDDAEEKSKTKTITTWEAKYILVNNNKPLWMRNSKEITDHEYEEFYKMFSKDQESPLQHLHFKAEGGVTDFRGLVFIPKNPSFNPFSKDEPDKFLSLFVKRVFITDQFRDLFPRYLSFIKALIDADDIPLNVSREMLQKHKILTTIKKTLVSKTLNMFSKMATNETLYNTFYSKYANHLKLGVMTDEDNKNDLAALLRFHSSSFNNTISLDSYVERMSSKVNQSDIFYVSGNSLRDLKKLPYVERLLKSGYEILYMIDPFDEYVLQVLTSYKGHSLKNIAKSGTKLTEDTEEIKKEQEETTSKYKPLTDHMKKLFSSTVDRVVVSNLLDESPMAILSSQYGYSPSMEKLMKAHKDEPMYAFFGTQKKIIEINPSHPLIEGLLKKAVDDLKSPELEADLRLLYDAALIHSGFELNDPAIFAHRIEDMIRSRYGLDPLPKEKKVEQVEDKEMPDFMNMMGGGRSFGDIDFEGLNADGMHEEL